MSKSPALGSGFDAMDAAIQQEEANRPTRTKGFRHYMKYGETQHLVLLDDEPGFIGREHRVYLGKRWDSVICPDPDHINDPENSECPLCSEPDPDRPSLVGYFTVLKITHWPDEDEDDGWRVIHEIARGNGDLVVNPIQILPAKQATIEVLKKQKQKRDGLLGAHFEVSRSNDDKSPNVGDMWDFEGKLTKEQILYLNEEAAPIENWEEALGIMDADELRAKLSNSANSAARDNSPSSASKSTKKGGFPSNNGEAPSPKGRNLQW